MTASDSAARGQNSALIGYTGFVGSNLMRQHPFDAAFNSANIDGIAGRTFDLVVCCGARAEKWKANADPERDYDGIERLIRPLGQANIRRLVLVSTVDVFLSPIDVNEDSPTPLDGLHAYGRNRRRLEQIVAGRFDATIVRLPGLYGPGLKKNAIHDLLHNHEVHKIDSRGVFQFYNVERLWRDIAIAMDRGIPLAHLPTEPVSVADVARAVLDIEFTNETAATPARYDVHTRYADTFGATTSDRYIENKTQELEGIAAFASAERSTDV
jgi:nucleoside-diphosphate-sugar epimerase